MGDNNSMGIAGGLTTMRSSGDSTKIPAQIRAMMAKRKAANKDNTTKVNVLDDIKAASANPNAASDAQKRQDSIGKTFDHEAYAKYLDGIGYKIVKKKGQ